jgi:hypothetical protein
MPIASAVELVTQNFCVLSLAHPLRTDCSVRRALLQKDKFVGLTLSVRAEYIYSAASQATSPDGIHIHFHKVGH